MEYVVSDPARITGLLAALQTHWRLEEDPAETLNRTFVDTFDWSVYLSGATLEWRDTPPRPSLIRHGLDQADAPLAQIAPAPPAFPADLPPGPVRTRLMEITDIRCLLPMMHIETHIRTFELHGLNDKADHPADHKAAHKTVAHLTIEASRFRDPRGGRVGELQVRVRVRIEHGDEDHVKATLKDLMGELGIVSAHEPILLEALAAAGRRPADYSSKLDFQLEPETRADLVTKQILRGLLTTLEANLDGARANLDSEFLHDLRVATRRTRSALSQLRGVFPMAVVAHFKEEFAWLQQITGPVRDLDVYLLDFAAYRQSLPAPLGADLEPLRDFLLAHYAAEQRRLAHALAADRFTRLLTDWRSFLQAPVADASNTPNGARPIQHVANQRIRAMLKRVRREGRAIRAESPPEDLHELRKSCKKLRYLMEFFQSLYPQGQCRALISLMKGLLDNLGSYQDLAVQAAHLRDLAQTMRDEAQAQTQTATLLAMGALIGNLLGRRQAARDQFDRVFADFLSENNQLAFRNLFDRQPSP
ncbi:CHAD domain-containing protein [Lamprocystis purpurea]|uniref:CHAD domain-containing protein n=1 Tax=Lamprocystis purpurea TaxID=61598 RepID=UPI00037F28AD|nr:CHAD domain-containing protein [Lamprocystis purpurea]